MGGSNLIELPMTPSGDSISGRFFLCDEATKQRLTLEPRSPGLPHQRHPMTVDEACAGILILIVCGAALIYTVVSWLLR